MRKRTIEDYVELLFILQKENKMVHTNDVASALDINPASVTEIFQKLQNRFYLSRQSSTLKKVGIMHKF